MIWCPAPWLSPSRQFQPGLMRVGSVRLAERDQDSRVQPDAVVRELAQERRYRGASAQQSRVDA
jgi:hypothetical protein